MGLLRRLLGSGARVERRVLINLAVFVVLGLVMLVWAVFNIVNFDFIDRPYRVTAEFESSPGLRANYQVAYLGRQVGIIDRAELVGDKVVVTLKMYRDAELPKGVSAAVRRQSAVGEPYVDIVAPGVGRASGGLLEDGDRIPIERTSTPLTYSEVFKAIDNVLISVPPEDLRTLTHELALGLEGRGESIRQLLTSADVVTSSLASNADLVDQVIGDLTRLTGTLAEHRGAVGGGIDNLASVADALGRSGRDIATLLEEGPSITEQLATLLRGAENDVGCLVESLGTVAERLGGPASVNALVRLLGLAPKQKEAILDITEHIGDTTYLKGLFIINSRTSGYPSPPLYPERHKLPIPPPIRDCAEVATRTDAGGPDASAGSGGRAQPSGMEEPVAVSERPEHAEKFPASSAKDVGGGPNLLFIVAFLAVAAAIYAARRFMPFTWGKRRGVR